MTKNELTDMEINEISLVDEPANDDARVVIFKSKAHKEPDADEEGGAPDGDADDKGKKRPMSVAKMALSVLGAIEKFSPQIIEAAVSDGYSGYPGAADTAASLLKETVMDMEAVTKALEEAEASLAALEKRASDAEAALKAKDEIIKAKDAEIAKAKAGDKAEDSDEEVLKSLPESIRKRLAEAEAAKAAAEAEIAKAKDAAELTESVEKAKALKVGDPAKVGALLLRVRKGMTTQDDAAAIEAVLKSAGEIAAHSPLFKSIGSSASTDASPEEVLKAKAEEIVTKSGGKLTYAQAYEKALDENPDVYADYVAKRRA